MNRNDRDERINTKRELNKMEILANWIVLLCVFVSILCVMYSMK